MRKYLIIVLICFTACFPKKHKNIVDVSHIDDRIAIGMTKAALVKEIGHPKDSLSSNREEETYYFIYDTNDFTGYTLKVWFNNEDEVTHYRVD